MASGKYIILVTGGGTIVKIDDVRHIGNFSTGSFSSEIADAALSGGHKVIYLHAKTAKLPRSRKNLKLVVFETYDEYAEKLKSILKDSRVDIAFLGAAVSDYGPKPQRGKIPSSKKMLTIKLHRLPKVIRSVKKWSRNPLFQVGFKLLSGASDQELIRAGYGSGRENNSELTIANDLAKAKPGKREVILVTSQGKAKKLSGSGLAKKILDIAEEEFIRNKKSSSSP